jgi:hypothetical protein
VRSARQFRAINRHSRLRPPYDPEQPQLKFRAATFRKHRHREISGSVDLEIYRRALKADGFARTKITGMLRKRGSRARRKTFVPFETDRRCNTEAFFAKATARSQVVKDHLRYAGMSRTTSVNLPELIS